MGLSWQFWSGLTFPPPGDLPGIESAFPGAPALADGFFTTEPAEQTAVRLQARGRVILFALLSDLCGENWIQVANIILWKTRSP